jgi:hypothetical protein
MGVIDKAGGIKYRELSVFMVNLNLKKIAV